MPETVVADITATSTATDAGITTADATATADAAATQAATDAAAATAAADKATADAAAAAKPIEYTLTLPEGSALDASALEKTLAIARESGLSNEGAQAMLTLQSEQAATVRDAALAAHAPGGEAYTKLLNDWKAETLADATLGKTPDERTAALTRGAAVIDKFAAAMPEQGAAMKAFLNQSGLGERREVAHFFAWLGKAAGESPLEVGGSPAGSERVADRMFPSSAKTK